MPLSGGEVSSLVSSAPLLMETLPVVAPISTTSVCLRFPSSVISRKIDNSFCTGDISTFPSSTELVVGPGADLRTYPEHEDAHLIESDTALVYFLVILDLYQISRLVVGVG